MRGIDAFGGSGKDATVASAGGTTLLEAGLQLVHRMRRTTGSGEPERGDAFRLGAQRLLDAGDLIASAQPRDWTGPGAESYGLANRRHARQVAGLAALDGAVQKVLARQADQIVGHRTAIDDEADRLARLSRTSQVVITTPGVGPAMKAAFEMTAVSSALDACNHVLHQLSQQVNDNTDELRGIAGDYSVLADDAGAQSGAPPEPEATTADGEDGRAPTAEAPLGTVATGTSPAAPTATAPAPAEPLPPSAASADAMSAVTSAVGAAGGAIGAMVAPLAAALTGAAGAGMQALSSLSVSPAADDADIVSDELTDLADDDTAQGRDPGTDREDDPSPDPAEEVEPAEAAADPTPPPLLPPAEPTRAAPIRPPR